MDNEGQISTAVELDYESLPEDAKYYMVMLMATDPSGAYDTIMVKITVTDGPDNAIIGVGPAENTAPAFADDAETDFMVYENMDAGAAVGMVDGHGRGRRHADVLGRLGLLRCRRHGQHHDDDDAGLRGDGQPHGDGHGDRR